VLTRKKKEKKKFLKEMRALDRKHNNNNDQDAPPPPPFINVEPDQLSENPKFKHSYIPNKFIIVEILVSPSSPRKYELKSLARATPDEIKDHNKLIELISISNETYHEIVGQYGHHAIFSSFVYMTLEDMKWLGPYNQEIFSFDNTQVFKKIFINRELDQKLVYYYYNNKSDQNVEIVSFYIESLSTMKMLPMNYNRMKLFLEKWISLDVKEAPVFLNHNINVFFQIENQDKKIENFIKHVFPTFQNQNNKKLQLGYAEDLKFIYLNQKENKNTNFSRFLFEAYNCHEQFKTQHQFLQLVQKKFIDYHFDNKENFGYVEQKKSFISHYISDTYQWKYDFVSLINRNQIIGAMKSEALSLRKDFKKEESKTVEFQFLNNIPFKTFALKFYYAKLGDKTYCYDFELMYDNVVHVPNPNLFHIVAMLLHFHPLYTNEFKKPIIYKIVQQINDSVYNVLIYGNDHRNKFAQIYTLNFQLSTNDYDVDADDLFGYRAGDIWTPSKAWLSLITKNDAETRQFVYNSFQIVSYLSTNNNYNRVIIPKISSNQFLTEMLAVIKDEYLYLPSSVGSYSFSLVLTNLQMQNDVKFNSKKLQQQLNSARQKLEQIEKEKFRLQTQNAQLASDKANLEMQLQTQSTQLVSNKANFENEKFQLQTQSAQLVSEKKNL
jgi:hypothetical protein